MSSAIPAISQSQSTTFTDVSDLAGVADRGESHGVFVVDYDNDGDLDIYVVNFKGTSNTCYRNNGDGTFTDVTEEAGLVDELNGHGGTMGDYDNDGYVDFYLANWDDQAHEPNVLFHNNGDGSFSDVTVSAGLSDHVGDSHGAIFLDYDNDGLLDIFVANTYEEGNYEPNILYHNNGDGTFTDTALQAGIADERRIHGMTSADFDQDGFMDLYVGDFDHPNALYHNNGDGTFTNVATEAGVDVLEKSHGLTARDYDNDGRIDIIVVNDNRREDFIYRNNGDGTFTKLSEEMGFLSQGSGVGVATADYDYDGDLDIYVCNSGGEENRLFQNQGDGTFVDVTAEAGLVHVGNHRAAVFFDYDNDGDLDLYALDRDGPNILYRNEGNGNHWLKVRLVGEQSNRNGIGARVSVVSEDLYQVREMNGGGGAFQDGLQLAFGLGHRTQIDELTVQWPSGITQTFTSIGADQAIVITESGEIVPDVYIQPAYVLRDAVASPYKVAANGTMHTTVTVEVKPYSGETQSSVPRVEINLSRIGGEAAVLMYDDGTHGDALPGDDVYTVLVTVPIGTALGEKRLSIVAQDEASHAYTMVAMAVYPAGDEYIYTDEVLPSWRMEITEDAECDPASTQYVHSGSYAQAITLERLGSVSYRPDAEGGIDTFGYVALEFYVNPGEAVVYEIALGNLALVRTLGITFEPDRWQRVSVPLEKLSIVNGRLSVLKLWGRTEGTFYVDDMKLVAEVQPPTSVASSLELSELPQEYTLYPNVPNPFNTYTRIAYALPLASEVKLSVYDLLGQKVCILEEAFRTAGSHTVIWNGRDGQGQEVGSGVYLVQWEAGPFFQVHRMVLIR